MLMSMTYLNRILPVSISVNLGGGSTRNTKGEYVVLVCQHYLPTQLARVFTVFEKLVAAYLYRMRISRVRTCVFLMYAHDTPPRVQHFSETVFGVRESPITVESWYV